MKKSFVLILMLAFFLTGCSSLDLDKVKEFGDPMTENMLQGMNNDDYNTFSKDFGSQMKESIDEAGYNDFKEQIIGIIGEYQSKELVKASYESSNGQKFIVAIYQAKFSNEPEDVAVTVTFSDDPENRTIEGLFFNSPKLVENSK
ncbi:MAG: DUF3887 domain-containing protein [Eubacteriales bacterium]